MPRLPAGIGISLKMRGGPTHRIELARQPTGRRYWACQYGKHSTKVPQATAIQIAERIRRWLVANTKATWRSEETFLCCLLLRRSLEADARSPPGDG